MKISLNWLKTLVDFKSTPQELADGLTMAGLEVDSIDYPYEHLKDVLTGKIESITPHPNADKLRICMVNTGGDENLKIVCGAPNVYEGMVGPVALPGSELPGGLKLKKSKIRGEESFGMLCSARELEITEEASGIMDLPKDIKPGTPLIDALGLNDIVIEVDLTPNRADCLSMIGVAREVAAMEGIEVKYPTASKYNDEKDLSKIGDIAEVEVKDKDLCPKYCARYIEDVKIGPSPWWLQQRLLCAGLRPLNNIVDITNFIMMETGQPLHAFDYDELKDSKVVVQRAAQGEKFTTLDGKERELDSEMLMICDNERKVAVGGVMGGENSEISDKTTKVLLESAYFFPPSVRKTAKRLTLATDSSHRFERGIDPDNVVFSLNRAAELIEELSGGKTVNGYIDTQEKDFDTIFIDLDTDACNRRLGTSLSKAEIASYLNSVGFETEDKEGDFLKVKVPSYRVDVERPEDLSEEVARRFGYNNIVTTFPGAGSTEAEDVSSFTARTEVKEILKGMGFNEVINYSFISPALIEKSGFKGDLMPETVKILNPLSEDQSVMRTSLIPGILENIRTNISQQTTDLKIFETGQIFIPDNTKANVSTQEELICAAWTGKRIDAAWDSNGVDVDFFDIKGIAEVFFQEFKINVNFKKPESELPPYTRPGAAAEIYSGETKLGVVFEIHHRVIKDFDINQPVFVFLSELDRVIENKKIPSMSREIPKYPASTRDITLITPVETATGEILEFLNTEKEELLESADLFDVYKGEPVPENEKSISFRLTYRAKDKTLKDKQVNKVHDKLTAKLLKNFNIRFPGQE
jgi:phenylalanyl-tRNA synthetase beta chain